jgi:hypothetical protein
MRSIDRAIAASILTMVAVLPALPAAAGGSWVNVSPRSWGRVGSEIRLGGTFCDGQLASVTEGPWFAYLVAEGQPPVMVGRVHVGPNKGDYCQWRLKAILRVPAAAPGRYWLQVCDRGCTTGVGDLVGGGWFTVVTSESPRALAIQMQRLRDRVRESARGEARREQMLDELGTSLERAETDTRELRQSVAELRVRLAQEKSSRRSWLVGAVASGTAAIVFGLVLLRRRRTTFDVPDTPEELLELTRLGR